MATKSFKELKNLTTEELGTKLRELEKQLFEERMKKAAGTLADSAMLWRVRKNIARVKTLQTAANAPAKREQLSGGKK